MKTEDDDDMLPEYDLSNAVRGMFADRWTPEEREAIVRDGAYGSVRAMTGYSLERLQALESALFTYLVLTGEQPVPNEPAGAAENGGAHPVRDLSAIVAEAGRVKSVDARLLARLQHLVEERTWMMQRPDEPFTGPGSFNHIMDRLDAIYNEARALKARVDELVQQHLARSGMSAQEIERKTEETAKLWLAA